MSRWFLLSLCGLLGFGVVRGARGQVKDAALEMPSAEQTTSTSKQFRIYGGTRRARNTFAAFAERQKESFVRTLDAKDDWHHPIVIRISGQVTDRATREPIDWKVNQFGDTFALEIRVTLSTEFSREKMSDTLIHMLMFERALRDVEADVTDQLIPRWLREGLPGALRRRRAGRPSGYFKTMFELNLVTPAREILTATKDDVDAVGRSVFEASASGFVLMLLDQQEGANKLAKLIHGYGGGHGAEGHDLVARYFPALRGTDERLERSWVLYCAKLAAPQALEFLGPIETEAQLVEALKVKFLEYAPVEEAAKPRKKRRFLGNLWGRPKEDPDDDEEMDEGEATEVPASATAPPDEKERPTREFNGSLADFERFIRRKDRTAILSPVRQQLLQLGFRSFPLHRPVVEDYQKLVGDLMAGQVDGVEDRLQALEVERQRLVKLMQKASAFMDAYEKSMPKRKTGVFDGYLERARAIESDSKRSQDPISKYLDEVERALK